MIHQVNIGVIGMGWMGMVHSRAYRAVPDRFYDSGIRTRLVICADEVESRARRAHETLGFESYTTDWRAVINHPDVQVVSITSPNFLHVEMVQAAAAAGKHILCEKPVGRSPAETALCELAARQAGVLTWVGFNYRWAPMLQYAHQLIGAGRLGKLTHYRGRFFAMYGSNPFGLLSWRFDAERAGTGVLGDLMSHVVDTAHFLAGPVKRVTSRQQTFIRERPLPIPGTGTHFSLGKPGDPTGPVTNEDYASALVEFENGALGTFESCRVIFGPKCENTFEINGTEGAIKWNYERLNELELYLPGTDGLHDGYTRLMAGEKYPNHGRFNPGDGNSIGYEELKCIEAYQFLQSVVDGQQRSPGFAEALQMANTEAAMMRSWASGQWEEVEQVNG